MAVVAARQVVAGDLSWFQRMFLAMQPVALFHRGRTNAVQKNRVYKADDNGALGSL